MDYSWLYTFMSILAVSLISLTGIVFLIAKKAFFNKIQKLLVSFAVGSLLGGAILHLIPESLGHGHSHSAPVLVVISILCFFILEKYLHFHRRSYSGDEHNKVKSFGLLNLVADAFHNFLDGILIATAYSIDVQTGVIVSLTVLAHELPQEIGDFAVLVQAGYSRKKALAYNFISALSAFIGGGLVFAFPQYAGEFSHYVLPLAAGGFIYIALADLIPELNYSKSAKSSVFQVVFMIAGLAVMWLLLDSHHMHH